MKPVITAAVFSDTHSNTALMVEAVARTRPDVIIHLGDYDRDTEILRRKFPEIPLYSVQGNCDIASSAPLADIVPLGPVKALIAHGHTYNVDWGIDSIVYSAQEQGAKLALFGHTHRPLYEEVGGVQVLNPGSAGKGREPTWAQVEVFENGGIACQIKKL